MPRRDRGTNAFNASTATSPVGLRLPILPTSQPLPAGLSTLQSANSVRYDLLMAGAVVASVPVLVLFVFLQRYMIEGVSRSGLKG